MTRAGSRILPRTSPRAIRSPCIGPEEATGTSATRSGYLLTVDGGSGDALPAANTHILIEVAGAGKPLFSGGENLGDWDHNIHHPRIVPLGDRLRIYYGGSTGNTPAVWKFGYAEVFQGNALA